MNVRRICLNDILECWYRHDGVQYSKHDFAEEIVVILFCPHGFLQDFLLVIDPLVINAVLVCALSADFLHTQEHELRLSLLLSNYSIQLQCNVLVP